MTTSLKDVSSAQMIRSLAELGCFEHENSAFGCAYWEEGKVYYRLGSEWERVNAFVSACPLRGLYPTPIMSKTVRQATLSGTEEDVKLTVKLQVGRELAEAYGPVYFELMARLSQEPADGSAGEILEAYRDEIDGFFDADQLQLLEGLMGLAYQAKLLTRDQLQRLQGWLLNVRLQMDDDVIIKHNFSRTFYAYAELDPAGGVRRVINANEKTLMEQKWAAQRRGLLTSPVFQKTCWYVKAADLAQTKKAFQERLEHLMDDAYLARLRAIRALPSAVDEALYAECLNQAQAECSPLAVQALADYGRLWNMALKV